MTRCWREEPEEALVDRGDVGGRVLLTEVEEPFECSPEATRLRFERVLGGASDSIVGLSTCDS